MGFYREKLEFLEGLSRAATGGKLPATFYGTLSGGIAGNIPDLKLSIGINGKLVII